MKSCWYSMRISINIYLTCLNGVLASLLKKARVHDFNDINLSRKKWLGLRRNKRKCNNDRLSFTHRNVDRWCMNYGNMQYSVKRYRTVSLYDSPAPEISCSWVRWCMHKTIKIIVEATWGLPGWLADCFPPSARFEIVAGSEGGSSVCEEERWKAGAIQLHWKQ